jgi:hypothetical protein
MCAFRSLVFRFASSLVRVVVVFNDPLNDLTNDELVRLHAIEFIRDFNHIDLVVYSILLPDMM